MITITPEAYTRIREIMVKEEKTDWNLRMGVREGGCCGMDYMFGLDKNTHDDDQVFQQGEITLVCDNESHTYLDGTTVDYEVNEHGEGFVINNPNACRSCGSGNDCSSK
jgi:iron-sulfur cluster assembly protein